MVVHALDVLWAIELERPDSNQPRLKIGRKVQNLEGIDGVSTNPIQTRCPTRATVNQTDSAVAFEADSMVVSIDHG